MDPFLQHQHVALQQQNVALQQQNVVLLQQNVALWERVQQLEQKLAQQPKRRRHERISCPAEGCSREYGSNNKLHLINHKKECELYQKQFGDMSLIESPVLTFRSAGLHPIIKRFGKVHLQGAFLHHLDDMEIVLKYARDFFSGERKFEASRRSKTKYPDGLDMIHVEEGAKRIHLYISNHQKRTFSETELRSYWVVSWNLLNTYVTL